MAKDNLECSFCGRKKAETNLMKALQGQTMKEGFGKDNEILVFNFLQLIELEETSFLSASKTLQNLLRPHWEI